MKAHTKSTQENLTPTDALNILVEGNKRFVQNVKTQRNLQNQVFETSQGQYPFAAILSCIDSRVPAELVFDQGIGDIFSVRIAGNIINKDILGSIEYACKVAGSKIVVVMGHTKCGAVTAACQNVKLGNITHLLDKIKPAVEKVKSISNSDDIVEKVAIENIKMSIKDILENSEILKEMKDNNEIDIVGALYDVSNGNVEFL